MNSTLRVGLADERARAAYLFRTAIHVSTVPRVTSGMVECVIGFSDVIRNVADIRLRVLNAL